MPSSPFKCPVCFSLFDLDAKLPRTMMGCGHTVCSSCITDMFPSQNRKNFKCPVDNVPCSVLRKTINHFPKNQLLIQIIDEVSKIDFCQEHQRQIEWKSVPEDIKLCSECTFRENNQVIELEGSSSSWKDSLIELVEASRKQSEAKTGSGKKMRRKNLKKSKGSQVNEEELIPKCFNYFLAIILVFNPFFWWFSHEKKMMKISR